MKSTRMARLWCMTLAFCSLCLAQAHAFQASGTSSPPAKMTEHDGAHDFDFLIGNWKAHVRRLPDRLNGSDTWDVYDGKSNHRKLLDSNANFEEFEVDSPEKHLHIKAQTLRLYNPDSHQWSIYLLDLDKVFSSRGLERPGDFGSVRLAESFAAIGAHGAVLLSRWRQDLGSELDL